MIKRIIKKLFGTANQRYLNKTQPLVEKINEFKKECESLTDTQLKEKTKIFQQRIVEGETLDDLLVEAFAVVREAAKRTIGLFHYDVQLIGGIVLHQGYIAEMRTGEGKTLVATLTAYLNALSGKGVHVVTVNDYLVKRDAEWMGKIYKFLGLSVGAIYSGVSEEERIKAYQADITYGTNNEFGFDYLRDNMKYEQSQLVQRPLNFAIIDEVDSILIDEARTPLIISGPTEDKTDLYQIINKLMVHITAEHYDLDEKNKSINLNEIGMNLAEEWLLEEKIIQGSLYDDLNLMIIGFINQALRAHFLMTKDRDYIVRKKQIMIVDEFTGRVLEGRRYSEGLHQAIEAKENVPIQNENQTLASITFQNYFRLYNKISGMTGSAMTESAEFKEIYDLSVIEIPTNLPVHRLDEEDEIYRTAKEKMNAIVELVIERHKTGQPILIGTTTIDRSEEISRALNIRKVKHQVLNAKFHETEAAIIAQAGRKGAVTIATNMAGRGTDIMLGGNLEMMLEETLVDVKTEESKDKKITEIKAKYAEEKKEVLAAGGLLVIGTERHESRRIDNQLRGRSGRQGDIGRTKFFLSLEDDLMRVFGTEKLSSTMLKLGMEEGTALSHPWVSRALQKAQQKVESRNYDIRKNLLKYDDVMNQQRAVIYSLRHDLLDINNIPSIFNEQLQQFIEECVSQYINPKKPPELWNLGEMCDYANQIMLTNLTVEDIKNLDNLSVVSINNYINAQAQKIIKNKTEEYGADSMNYAIQRIMLFILDHLWKDHLLALDHLRQSIGLRAYAQKDPLNEYKMDSFKMFKAMIEHWRVTILDKILNVKIEFEDNTPPMGGEKIEHHPSLNNKKVGRNSLCSCGSMKKHKHCCGKILV